MPVDTGLAHAGKRPDAATEKRAVAVLVNQRRQQVVYLRTLQQGDGFGQASLLGLHA